MCGYSRVKWDKWSDVCRTRVWPIWQMALSLSFHPKLGKRKRAQERGHQGQCFCSQTFICLDSRQTPFRWPSQPEDRPFSPGLDPHMVPSGISPSSGSSRSSKSHNFSNFFAIVASAGWCFLPREGKKKWIIGAEQDPWGPGLTFLVIFLLRVAAEQKCR